MHWQTLEGYHSIDPRERGIPISLRAHWKMNINPLEMCGVPSLSVFQKRVLNSARMSPVSQQVLPNEAKSLI